MSLRIMKTEAIAMKAGNGWNFQCVREQEHAKQEVLLLPFPSNVYKQLLLSLVPLLPHLFTLENEPDG